MITARASRETVATGGAKPRIYTLDGTRMRVVGDRHPTPWAPRSAEQARQAKQARKQQRAARRKGR